MALEQGREWTCTSFEKLLSALLGGTRGRPRWCSLGIKGDSRGTWR
jgi:hypothetical protein